MTTPVPSTPRDPARLLPVLLVQLERDRRAFLWGNGICVAANLVLVGLVWLRPAGGPAAWIPAGIAFLGNVFYAMTADWELRWQEMWRRELPRLEREVPDSVLGRVVQGGPFRLGGWLRALSWTLSLAWLVALLIVLRASGLDLDFTSAGR